MTKPFLVKVSKAEAERITEQIEMQNELEKGAITLQNRSKCRTHYKKDL